MIPERPGARDDAFKFRMIQCFVCEHLRPYGRCEAFPDGIPSEIRNGNFDHQFAFAGDNGIRFEQIEAKPGYDYDAWHAGGDPIVGET